MEAFPCQPLAQFGLFYEPQKAVGHNDTRHLVQGVGAVGSSHLDPCGQDISVHLCSWAGGQDGQAHRQKRQGLLLWISILECGN